MSHPPLIGFTRRDNPAYAGAMTDARNPHDLPDKTSASATDSLESKSPSGAPENSQLETGLLFDAELTPHRSLGPRGFVILMGVICVVSFGAGLAFFLAGAWPVIGFMGVDVLLIYLAFKVNYRQARIMETLQLSRDTLTVRRIGQRGQVKTYEFQPYWLQVFLEDTKAAEKELILRSHGRSLRVGSFLAPHERAELATALSKALARANSTANSPA
ncbi:MAG: DUF2244 domain-containing protein [Pseudomonadota bacterium]